MFKAERAATPTSPENFISRMFTMTPLMDRHREQIAPGIPMLIIDGKSDQIILLKPNFKMHFFLKYQDTRIRKNRVALMEDESPNPKRPMFRYLTNTKSRMKLEAIIMPIPM